MGAVELVSPGSKDRPAARRAFAVKCLSCLQSGIGLVIADVVPERSANLHDTRAEVLGSGAPPFPGTAPLYAAACRPFRRGDEDRVAIWPVELRLGDPLPVLPLWLRRLRIDLDAAYTEACRDCLIGRPRMSGQTAAFSFRAWLEVDSPGRGGES